jgi:transposase-like protein
MLSRWIKAYREGKIKDSPFLDIESLAGVEMNVSVQKIIREFQKALKNERVENDILRKAIQSGLKRL